LISRPSSRSKLFPYTTLFRSHLYAWLKLVLDTMFLRCPECGGCAYCYDRGQNLPKPRSGNIRFYGRVIVEVDIGVGFEGLVFELLFLHIHFEEDKTFGTIHIRDSLRGCSW